MTAVKAARPVRAALRKAMLSYIFAAVRKLDYDSLTNDVVTDKLQKDTLNAIRKIAPIRSVDIRVMKYLGEHKGPAPEMPVGPVPVQKKEPVKELAEEDVDVPEEKPKKGKHDGPAAEESSEDLGEDAPEEGR
jgi:hypothetical protein